MNPKLAFTRPLLLILLLIISGCSDKPDITPDENPDIQLLCYPNPTDNVLALSVQNPSNKTFTLRLFDSKADLLFEKSGSTSDEIYLIDLEGKPRGTYQAVLKVGGITITRKIVVV